MDDRTKSGAPGRSPTDADALASSSVRDRLSAVLRRLELLENTADVWTAELAETIAQAKSVATDTLRLGRAAAGTVDRLAALLVVLTDQAEVITRMRQQAAGAHESVGALLSLTDDSN